MHYKEKAIVKLEEGNIPNPMGRRYSSLAKDTILFEK